MNNVFIALLVIRVNFPELPKICAFTGGTRFEATSHDLARHFAWRPSQPRANGARRSWELAAVLKRANRKAGGRKRRRPDPLRGRAEEAVQLDLTDEVIPHVAGLVVPAVVVVLLQLHAVLRASAAVIGIPLLPTPVAAHGSVVRHPPPLELVRQVVATRPETAREGVCEGNVLLLLCSEIRGSFDTFNCKHCHVKVCERTVCF